MRQFHIAALLMASGLLTTLLSAQPPTGFEVPDLPVGHGPVRLILDRYPLQPTQSPAFAIPLGPLGFAVPGNNYLLRNESLISLDFLDEDRLLFTFHVSSGLKQRKKRDNSDEGQQSVQALVVALPSGKIETQATWTVPDRSRYLWMLNDGTFLLRVGEGLDQGNAELKMKPYLHQPGRLLWIDMDPAQQVVVTNTLEPATTAQVAGASTAPSVSDSAPKPGDQSMLVARTVRRSSGEVLHETRFAWANQTTDWPMNSEGYLERSKNKEGKWVLKLSSFAGPERVLTTLDSNCPPKYGFISDTELLLSRCDTENGWMLGAMSTRGDSLWSARSGMNSMAPLLVLSSKSSRVARETLLLKRTVDHYKHLVGARDFLGQVVRVFDAEKGKTLLEAPLTPIFDGGGNVAISPSGHRVAILSSGAIQVFELPPPQATTHH